MSTEAWRTDDELFAAGMRFAEKVPGYASPAAYSVARLDGATLTFAHVNRPGGGHLLPAVVLASECGRRAQTATYRLTAEQFAAVIELLAPAEAATHWEHPNLWSWRELARTSPPGSAFVACFVHDVDDPIVDGWDAAFRALLAR